MDRIGIHSVISNAFKANSVRCFFKMGPEKAIGVINSLERQVPLHGDKLALVEKLQHFRRMKGEWLLKNALPEMTIGYKFDLTECQLLSSMNGNWGYKVIDGFPLYRAGHMWRAFFKFNRDAAVCMLDMAGEDRAFIMKAIGEGPHLHNEDKDLIKEIFNVCSEYENTSLSLPVDLVALNDPVILDVVQDTRFEILSEFFVRHFISMDETLSSRDMGVIKLVFQALGPVLSYQFYNFLVKDRAIDADRYLDKEYPDQNAVNRASTLGKIDSEITDKISTSVVAGIYDQIIYNL